MGRIRRWKLSELLAYERACAGLPPLPRKDDIDEIYLTAAQLRQRLNVSDMWIWRRQQQCEAA
jgi:hypothetical protein